MSLSDLCVLWVLTELCVTSSTLTSCHWLSLCCLWPLYMICTLWTLCTIVEHSDLLSLCVVSDLCIWYVLSELYVLSSTLTSCHSVLSLTSVHDMCTLCSQYMFFLTSFQSRVVPDIRLGGYSAIFHIRYPAGYPVTFAGYPVKLLNKWCKLRMSKLFSKPLNKYKLRVK